MAEIYNTFNHNLNNSLSTQYSDKIENVLMKVDVMKPVTTNSGAAQVLFINTKHKKTKSEGKTVQNEILTNNYISDGGLKQKNMKYYNSTTFNKSNYVLTKKSSSIVNPTNNGNNLQISTYSVSVRDNSELNMSNLSKDEGNQINSNTKILVTNVSKEKREVRLKVDSNDEKNKRMINQTESNNPSKIGKENIIKSYGKNISEKQINNKNRAISADSKKKLNAKTISKKEQGNSEEYLTMNDTNLNQINSLKNIIDLEDSNYSNNKEIEAKETISQHYHTEQNLKTINKIKKDKINKKNLINSKEGLSKKDKKQIQDIGYQQKIQSGSNNIIKDSEKEREDPPMKILSQIDDKLSSQIINNETDQENNKTKNNVDTNNIKAKMPEKRNNHNTFNNITPKINKSKNSVYSNQSDKEQVKILTMEEKIELMGKLVRNKEEEIIKQVQKEVIEKSKHTNEKIQKKLRYLNSRNMLDNINLEEIELGVNTEINEERESNENINKEQDKNRKEDDTEEVIDNEGIHERKLMLNLNKQKRSKSSPHVTAKNKKHLKKPRINTNEYIKQINHERNAYFEDNEIEENAYNINIEMENNLNDNNSNDNEGLKINSRIASEKNEHNEIRLAPNHIYNENNSFRKSISGDKSRTVQRSASASVSSNSRIIEANDYFAFPNNYAENYGKPHGFMTKVLNQKRSSAEIQNFIKRKRKEDKEKAIKLKNAEDNKSLKKLVELTKIEQTQERIFKRGNNSHSNTHSQNPNSVLSINTTKSKNKNDFKRYQEDSRKSYSANKIKNEMYVGKRKKNPNDSSIVDPDEYYLSLLESKNILVPSENILQMNKENINQEHPLKIENKYKVNTEYNEKSFLQIKAKSQIQSQLQSRSQSPIQSQIQSERSFNLKLIEREISRHSLQQSQSYQNNQLIQSNISQLSHNSQINQNSQNSLNIQNAFNFKSFEEKNFKYDQQRPSINEDPLGNSNIIKDKSQKEVTKRSINNSNDILSLKSVSKYDSPSYQQCDTANFKGCNDINDKLNEMKAKVSEFKQRAIILRENNTKDDIDKSLSLRSNKLSDKGVHSLVDEVPKSKDIIQSFLEPIEVEHDKDVGLSEDVISNYNDHGAYYQDKSSLYNDEEVYNQMKSVSYSKLVPLKSDEKRDRVNSDLEFIYKSYDIEVINKNIINHINDDINPTGNKLDESARLSRSGMEAEDIISIEEMAQLPNQPIELEIDIEKLNRFTRLIKSATSKNIFIKFGEFLASYRKLEQTDMALNYLDAIADGFMAKNVFVSFQMIHQYAIMRNYYDIFNLFSIASKRDAFKKLCEYADIVKLYEEEEMNVYENSLNSLCLFAKRSAFNEIKEFAFNSEMNDYEADEEKLIEVYTISFSRLFLPWKRNLFYELLNKMYQLMITPRHLDREDTQSNNNTNNFFNLPEDENVTVQINKDQSPTKSQLWYNKEADDEDILRKNSNKSIKDKSISHIKDCSLTDDIQIESIANITNRSEVSKNTVDEERKKSSNKSKMQMFDKNAALSGSKNISVNESKESYRESLLDKSSVKNSFRNIKNNTFVHESFTERSFLIEFNSFDSPKLHRIHMLIEQQKRAQQINSHDEPNISNNISQTELSMNMNMSMSNISEKNTGRNDQSSYYPSKSGDCNNKSINNSDMHSNSQREIERNIANESNYNNSDHSDTNHNASIISDKNGAYDPTNNHKNISNIHSLLSKTSIKRHNSNDVKYNNITGNVAKEINKTVNSIMNLSINSFKENPNISGEVVNKSTSTLNKFSNLNNNISNHYSKRSRDEELSQDENSQYISEHFIDSKNRSHISEKYTKSEDDISVDINRQGYSDVEWMHTFSVVSKSGSFPDGNANNSIRNSVNLNIGSCLDNQINKSVENSKVNYSLDTSKERKQYIIDDIDNNILVKNDHEKTNNKKLVEEEDAIEEDYDKFEDVEIEIDYDENEKELFNLVKEDNDTNKSVSIRSLKSERNSINNLENIYNDDEARLMTKVNPSTDLSTHLKSRNILENNNKNDLSLSNENDKIKSVPESHSNNSLQQISYDDLGKLYYNYEDSLRESLSKSLSHSKVGANEDKKEAISDPAGYANNRDKDRSINAEVCEEKIILDENNINDKVTIETAKEESSRLEKKSEEELISIKPITSLDNNNILTIESVDHDDTNREFFKVKSSCQIKSYNLLDDKSSNKSSIIPLSDSDFNTIENKGSNRKENQTLSANKQLEDSYDDMTSLNKHNKLLETKLNDSIIPNSTDEFRDKLKVIDDLNRFAEMIAEDIFKNLLESEINNESNTLTPKKQFLREKDSLHTAKKGDTYLINPQCLTNDSISSYSTSSNYQNTSMFNKTVIEHKKEASLNLYQEKVAPGLINLITESIETNYSTILSNLGHPYINKPDDLIQAITYRDYKMLRQSHKILPETYRDSAFINKKEILCKFEGTNKQIREEDNITSDNYYDNILNECMIDAANEILKKERHYGDLGQPLPWSTRTRSVRYKYNQYSVNNMKKFVSDQLTQGIQFKMGLITDNNENMEFELLNLEREKRLLNKIVEEINETEEQWKNFEIEETQIKFEMSDLIFEQLLNEVIEILEHVLLSRRKPQLYQNKSIYACEDIPRLSFQHNNTDHDSDNINQ